MTKQLNSLQYGNDIYNLRNTYYGTIAGTNVSNGLLTINVTIDSSTQESEEDAGFPLAVGNILTLFANNAQTETGIQSVQLRFNNGTTYPVYWDGDSKPLIWGNNTVLNFMFRKTIQSNTPTYSFIYLGTENKIINGATAQIKSYRPNRREIILSHDASPTSKVQITSFDIPNYEFETNSIPPAPYFTLGTRASNNAGQYSTSIGYDNTVSGNFSFAEGYANTTSGYYSSAEGYANTASGNYSFARGHTTKALGFCSHTEGNNTIATGASQTVLGRYNLEDKIIPTQTIEIDQTQKGLIYENFTFKIKSSDDDEELDIYYSESEINSITLTGEGDTTTETEQYFFYYLNNQQNLWVQTSQDNLSSIEITYSDGEKQELVNPGLLDEFGNPTESLDPDWLQKGYYIELNQSFSDRMTITGKRGIEDFSINVTNNTVININDAGALITTIDLQTGDILTIQWPAVITDRYAMIIGNGIANNKRSNALTVDWDGNIETGGAIVEPVGTILPYAGEYEPKGWMFCDGRALLRIDYPSLFSIIGTKYGSANINTPDDGFLLPNLNGRTLVGASSEYELGAIGGEATHTLTIDEMPTHTHATRYYNQNGSSGSGITYGDHYRVSGTTEVGSMVHNRGGSQPHNNMQPYLAVNYIICVKNVNPEIEIPETPPVYSQPLIHMETISNDVVISGNVNSDLYEWDCPSVTGYTPFAISGYRFNPRVSSNAHENRLNVWVNTLNYDETTSTWKVQFRAYDIDHEGVNAICYVQIAYIRDFTQ